MGSGRVKMKTSSADVQLINDSICGDDVFVLSARHSWIPEGFDWPAGYKADDKRRD
jgi:hypothetical protein